MMHGLPARGSVTLGACALVVALAACDRRPVDRAAHGASASQKPPVAAVAVTAAVDGPRLPEDPIAGKRSEQQWREHQAHEEHERQLWFDRERVRDHRAVVELMKAARARYERARTEAAVTEVRAAMPARLAEMRRRWTKIDPWGNNSPLLRDYEVLSASLANTYADARIAAIRGEAHALDQERADFDRRIEAIADWLEEAAASEYE